MTMRNLHEEKGAHQNVARVTLVLSILADASREGMRFKDVVTISGLSKTAAHRLLAGMVQYGLVDFEEATARYYLGLDMAVWSSEANNRYGLAKISEDELRELSEETEDTVYLMVRSNSKCMCVARVEGSYPIKTLTIDVGAYRPLGAGAGPLAILAHQPDPEIDKILKENEVSIREYGFSIAELKKMVTDTRSHGYATIDNRIVPGMSGVSVPIKRHDGVAFAAINIVAVQDRMNSERRQWIASTIKTKVSKIEEKLSNILTVDGSEFIISNSIAEKAQ
ncbi:IclR family transcriptional regulator [Hoeflea prorocentri]|uniref:IclR family transcriptional regulator n=1 Tax=Hoeflea prorocentri TaxID=1922333 RepID=A0A9X3UEK3_9HYPH|nr:IclR family transcriptional regulator [Hoeflea prorocentri]MCY6379404.1 IclR family transcriptional regulator [Hoeflea prorocentri]MDA5397205.1 IclR family transcriptional regulator [Hoeflea prorocentri]